MAPWVQLHAQTNGKVSPCCMTSVHSNNEIGDLRENPDLAAAWNSANMKQLRLDMLHNKKNSLCAHCYKYEELGKVSERQYYNRDYKSYFSRVEHTGPDGSLEGADVPLIDIRFSNKCNYKCRICSSEYSSLWYEEEQKLNADNPHARPKEMKAAGDQILFWESYKKMLPYARRLHFAGGEPLMMDEHYQVLEHLLSIGNRDAVLSYNTNFSTLRYKQYNIIELWKQFKSIDIWASLDGMSEKGDYQRKGQKWEKIEENIRAIQQHCPNALFGVNITVSILNILDIPAFYKYLVDHKLADPERINLYLLFDPSYYNITHLTPAIKAKALSQFEDLEKNYLSKLPGKTKNIRNHISAVISYMMSEEGDQREVFRQRTSALDAIRNENFLTVYPELVDMMQAPLPIEKI